MGEQAEFEKHFRDIRTHRPNPGEVVACYSATADLVDGPEKRQVIDLLSKPGKATPATAVMRNLLYANQRDAVRVPMEMAEDLLGGMTADDVAKKPYRYTVQMHFYAKPEDVPGDDPHWSVTKMVNMAAFAAAASR